MQNILNTRIELVNHRARLEPLTMEHFDELSRIAYDPLLWQFTTTRMLNDEDLHRYLLTAMEEKAQGASYPFAVYDRISGQIAGSTRFANISSIHRRVEIGWTWYARPFQRTGLNRACKFELLQLAFEKMNCIRVELKTGHLNTQSQTAMEKIGATREGVLRSHMLLPNGNFRDTIYFSILQPEWPGIKESIFKEYMQPVN